MRVGAGPRVAERGDFDDSQYDGATRDADRSFAHPRVVVGAVADDEPRIGDLRARSTALASNSCGSWLAG